MKKNKKSKKEARFVVVLPRELADMVREEKEKRGTSKKRIIEDALKKYFENDTAERVFVGICEEIEEIKKIEKE